MANNSPTLVAASLSDEQLKKSIDSLVTHVDETMKKMVDSTNRAVGEMEAKLKSLGNLKIDSNGTSDGGASRRTKSQNAETDAIEKTVAARDKQIKKNKEVEMSFDQIAAAQQKASRLPSEMRMDSPKSARESFYVFQQTLTTRARQLTSEIKSAENAFNTALDIKLQSKQLEWQQKLEHTQQKLAQFRASMGTNPSVQQMREEQRILNLMEQQQAMLNKIRGQRAQMLQPLMELQKEEQKVVSTMYDIFQGQKQSEQATQQTAQSAQRFTVETEKENRALQEQKEHLERIKEVAAQAREHIGQYGFANIMNYRGVVYAENDERAKGLTIEQQIEKIIQEENAARNAQLGTERQITQEVEKRGKKYDSPNAEINTAFNRMVANKIGLSEQDINTTSTKISTLTQYIKQLEQAWSKMTDAEKNSPFGKQLRQELQYTTRLVQKARTELTRPINLKDALGGTEKTLDDIAYKISRLQSYKRGIDITNPKSTAEIKDVDREIVRLTKDLNKYMQVSKEATEVNGALGRSWNYMKNRLAFYFTVGATTSFIKQLVDIRGQYEMLERSIGILIDSAQNGSRIFAELNSMAIKSPFTTMELGAAAKQLVAYDVAAKDVVDTTRRLADMAAAVGIPIERLTYALGQIKAYGYLNARDARMFANAGIPLVKELADYYTELEGRLVSTSDVYDRIKKKAISYNDVIEVTNRMTDEGGKFFNFQEKAADTLKVRLANLSLAWNNMLNEIGKDNQGILTSGLVTLKDIFEQWRSIFNLISAVVVNIGLAKAGQLIFYLATLKSAKGMGLLLAATEKTFGTKIASRISNICHLITSLLTPSKLLIGVVMGLGIALTKLYLDYKDIQDANENLNESIIKNAEENISSIDKFFKEYSKQLRNIDTAPLSDQNKMWERLQEEIEKTSHNAEAFIRKLNDIGDTSERIRAGENVLDTIKNIQNEASRLAGQGLFEIGGGFADDDLSKDIKELDEVSKKLNGFKKQIDAGHTELKMFVGDATFEYMNALKEAEKELDNFSDKFYNANLGAVMGLGDDRLERLREFTSIVRDNFLATEQGSKISSDGIARINASIDKWIGRMAYLNGLQSKQESEVEANRTAWEEFFRHVDRQDREHLDFLIKNNQTGSDEFKKIWDDAAKNMLDSASTSYDIIKDQIAALRDTPDIVIKVVYQKDTDNLNPRQERFVERWIEPKSHIQNWESYSEERKKNENRYIRFNFKEGEDDVEHEKRLGQQYQENTKSIKSLNDQLKKSTGLSKEDREEKEKQRDTLVDENEAILKIGEYYGYNYDQFKKGGKGGSKKDPVLETLKEEISLVDRLQSDYDKLAKSGASQADALSTIQGAYGKTINLLNAKLGGYGLPQIDISNLIVGKDPNKALEHFKQTLNALVSKGMLSLERSKEIEGVIEKFTLSAKTYNLEKITKGLNNELDKIKDEYELAVELDANPELGGMFAEMMGIDTDSLPQTFGEAFDKANEVAKQKLRELNVDTEDFDLMKSVIKPDETGKWMGLEFEGNAVKELLKGQKAFQDLFKKNLTDTEKHLDDFIKKYGLYADKVAEIESDRLSKIKRLNDAYYTEEMRKLPEYIAKLNAINEGASREKSNAEFDEFKNSRYYTMIFENLDYVSTKTIRDMRDRLRDLMDTMNNLTPEQLKQIMSQYEKLEQKLSKRSPFRTLARDLKSYFKDTKNRKAANKDFRNAQKEYDAQMKKVAAMKENYEQIKANNTLDKDGLKLEQEEINTQQDILEKLREKLELAQKIADKYNLAAKLAKEEAIAAAQVVASNLSSLAELRDNLKETFGLDMGDNINAAIDGFAKAGEGISKAISSLQSGDVVGAASGVVSIIGGIGDGIASIFGDGAARTKKINKEIANSTEEVRRLNMAYDELEYQVDKAMGAEEIRARRSMLENKKAELAEIERQKALEESKRSKDRDDDAIKQYDERIQELNRDINDLASSVAETLLGSDIKSAAEDFVSTWVDAWRAGEDTMAALESSFDDMIDHMILKAIASKLIAKKLEPIFKAIDSITGDESQEELLTKLNNIKNLIENGTAATGIDDTLRWLYGYFGIEYGSNKSKSLSALQQGIQSITEDTAGALEAITNGISQQCYLQSDILIQIRDTVQSFDIDIQTASLSQILLQLQSSYQLQQSMLLTMENWTNPSGNAVRVELIS